MSGVVAASFLATACGAVQLLITMALLRKPERLDALRRPEAQSGTVRRRPPTFESVGRVVIRLLKGRGGGLASAVDPLTARTVGLATVLGTGLLPFGPVAFCLGAASGWTIPRYLQRKAAKARSAGYAQDLPEVVDLLVLALDAGLNIPLAVEAVGRRGTGPLARAMAVAAHEARRGRRLADALDDLVARCGEPVRPLMALLASGERYGVPLAESLDRLAVDVRAVRRRQAEEAARRLPVKMLFPLVLCILPAFALLTLGPLLVTSFRNLAW